MNALQQQWSNNAIQKPYSASPELTKMIDGFRTRVKLEPKGEYVSNFILESPALEIHIIANAFDEMRQEIDAMGCTGSDA